MTSRSCRMGLLVVGLAFIFGFPAITAAAAAAEKPAPVPDLVSPVLDKYIRGQSPLDDVRVEALWLQGGKAASARVYGSGTVICNESRQFSVKKEDVVSILKELRKARFGAMPANYGEAEGEEEEREKEKNEGPQLRGRIRVRAGTISKSVAQLVDGEQSPEFEALARRILQVCGGTAPQGTGADNLADGLQKVASSALAPEVLEIIVQRRADGPNKSAGQTSWILELEGRRLTDRLMPAGQMPPAPRLLILSPADFEALAKVLVDAHPSDIPVNVYEPMYTDVSIALLKRSRNISGRRFANMTPETHGDKQKSFDRLFEAFLALHDRVQKEGKTIKVTASSAVDRKEAGEKEREREKEKKKETGTKP